MKGNTQLPRALANRVWGWLFGAGIVNPVDDFNLKNRAVAPVVLHTLVKDQTENNTSLKRLVRVICATKSYQQATPEEAPGTMSFRHLVGAREVVGRLDRPWRGTLRSRPWRLEVPKAWIPGSGAGRVQGDVSRPREGERRVPDRRGVPPSRGRR